MSISLWSSALLMGLVGGPHCLTMCGAACSAVASRCGGERPRQALLAWQLGRALAYSAAGAAVASSVGLLAQWGNELAWLKPWWLMLHFAALALGLWMLWHGRAPAWLAAPLQLAEPSGLARRANPQTALAWSVVNMPTAGTQGADSRSGPSSQSDLGGLPSAAPRTSNSWWRATAAGLAWVALPCGLLQAALVTAALGSSAVDGALVMASFAFGSGLSLWFGPNLWLTLIRWLPRGRSLAGDSHDPQRFGPVQATRLAGALLAIGALVAVWHTALAPAIAAFCS